MLRRCCLLVCLIACSIGSPVQAGIITITDTEPMIDFPDADCGCESGSQKLPELLPFALFDFSDQMPLISVTGIELTMTMQDGDTAFGELDHGNLTLQLDTLDTGIELNGFGAGQELTQTFSLNEGDANWLSNSELEQLILSLADNQLFASIHDATPDDNYVNLYSVFDTTIKLTGQMLSSGGNGQVPEPASVAVWGLALAALIGFRKSRARNKAS